MKKFLMALAVLAVVSAPALAGPNAGGTLVVHDTGLTYTFDSTAYPTAAPATCSAVDAELPTGLEANTGGYVWKLYAAFPENASPRLKALAFGATFSAEVYVQAAGLPDPVADFEISQGGWPTTSGGGVGVSFGVVKTNIINEVYWFGGYGYAGSWNAAPHPVQPLMMSDDSVPPQEDAIVGLSSIGFGAAGTTICPETTVEGACCIGYDCFILASDVCIAQGGTFLGGECTPGICGVPPVEAACCLPTGACEILTELGCAAAGGQWFVDEDCDPSPCGTPVEETSWGQIKANYR